MKSIVKGIKLIAIILLPFMLFIFVYRLANDKTSYLPVVAVFNNISSYDFAKPIQEFYQVIIDTFSNFSDFTANFSNVVDFFSFFNAFGDFIADIWRVLVLPVNLLVKIFEMILTYITYLYQMFTFIINYK